MQRAVGLSRPVRSCSAYDGQDLQLLGPAASRATFSEP